MATFQNYSMLINQNYFQPPLKTQNRLQCFNHMFFVAQDEGTQNLHQHQGHQGKEVPPQLCLGHDLFRKLGSFDSNGTNSTSASYSGEENTDFFFNEAPFVKSVEQNKKKNATHEESKTKKKLIIRKGDWKCMNCYNLNFSFRKYCNKCLLPKSLTNN